MWCSSPDGRRLASAGQDQTIKVWDLVTGRSVRTLEGHTNWIFGLAFSPDGKQLASASHDETVRVWNVADGREIQTLRGHGTLVLSVAFSPDGKRIASGSERPHDQALGHHRRPPTTGLTGPR